MSFFFRSRALCTEHTLIWYNHPKALLTGSARALIFNTEQTTESVLVHLIPVIFKRLTAIGPFTILIWWLLGYPGYGSGCWLVFCGLCAEIQSLLRDCGAGVGPFLFSLYIEIYEHRGFLEAGAITCMRWIMCRG